MRSRCLRVLVTEAYGRRCAVTGERTLPALEAAHIKPFGLMIGNDLLVELLEFRQKRNWEQFHKPKDLAVSLSVEAAELLEIFQ